MRQPPAAAAAVAAAAPAAIAEPLPPPPPAAPQPPAPSNPRQQLVAILNRCTEAGVLDRVAARLYLFQFGRMPAERQADELEDLAGLEAEGALAGVASCVRLATTDATAGAQQQ